MAKRKQANPHATPTPATKSLGVRKAAAAQLRDMLEQRVSDQRISSNEVEFALGFLKYFGYLKKGLENLSMGDFLKSIKAFQKFVGIDETGHLDQQTANVMQAPRCGIADQSPLKLQMALTGETLPAGLSPKWNKSAITWCMTGFVTGLPQSVQTDIVNTSYKQWGDICGLKISGTSNKDKADIIVDVGRGPRNQFDGPGNTLAWAYLPPGDNRQLLLLFDLDENWAANVTGSPREILMLNVATHEGGHTLGLEHSQVQTALMAPYYAANVSKPVSPDDVERIQKLYGKATAPTGPSSPTPGPAGSLPAQLAVSVWSGGQNGVVYKGNIQKQS